MNDTVREELETKIGRISGPLSAPKTEIPTSPTIPVEKPVQTPPVIANPVVAPVAKVPVVPPPASRTFTGEIGIKKTSPTLVDFQPKSLAVPDWRLQLQNSVRQRSSGNRAAALNTDAIAEPIAAVADRPTINGSLALKKDTKPAQAEKLIETPANDKVANALKRIEASRKAHLPYEQRASSPVAVAEAPAQPIKREHPFNVVSRTEFSRSPVDTSVADTPKNETRQKPRLVSSLRIEKRSLDTNKLPPIPEPANIQTSFGLDIANRKSGPLEPAEIIVEENDNIRIETDVIGNTDHNVDEIDDLAPFSLRLASGSFDIAIASMASAIILSPILAGAASWFTLSGVLLFSATLAIVLFLYLTASLSFWGRSFGMRLFSLELIDAEQNVYPTVHQAAVSSAVFLLSLATVGLGFITILFTEEKRAVHDIVSGTLIIRDI